MTTDIRVQRLVEVLRSVIAERKKLPAWSEEPSLAQLREWQEYWIPFTTINGLRNASELCIEIGLAGDATQLHEFYCSIFDKSFDFNSAVVGRSTGVTVDLAVERDRILIALGLVIAAAEFCKGLTKTLVPSDPAPAKPKKRSRFTPEDFALLDRQATKFLKSRSTKVKRDQLAEHLSVSTGIVSRLEAWKTYVPNRRGVKPRGRIGLGIASEVFVLSRNNERDAEQADLDRLIDEQSIDHQSRYVVD